MKRFLSMLLIIFFMTAFASVPANSAFLESRYPSELHNRTTESPMSPTIPSGIRDPESIRVAVYDEPNVTSPSYTGAYDLTNNISEIVTLLEAEGYYVDLITLNDIISYQLTTENYDVFIMVNNVPRENITNYVKQFWLAGGGVLSFNSAIGYLLHAGMIMPEVEVDPFGFYWDYKSHDKTNVTNLHPITRDYSVSDNITLRPDTWGTFYIPMWSAQGSVIEDDVTILLANFTQTDWGLACAIDSSYKGGRVVQLPGDGYTIESDMVPLIIKSVEYLAPRPKARVAYDLSHWPQLYLDSWDHLAEIYDAGESYAQLRNAYVNHSYIFDKFYPSSEGNFTQDRLAHYDMLIIAWPNLNVTSAERTALLDWVHEGGSIFLLADRSGFVSPGPGLLYINWIVEDFDMEVGLYNIANDINATPSQPPHPTTESCGSIAVSYRNYLNLTGPRAQRIYEHQGNIILASQEHGSGRVVLSSDLNIFTNTRLKILSNERLALNIGDWMTASEADILYMCNYPGSTAYVYPHNSPAALSLNELGLEYQITYSGYWMSKLLDWYDWEFVIADSPWNMAPYFDALADFIKEDESYLLMSYYLAHNYANEELWPLLGFEPISSAYTVPETTYIYEEGHHIFNLPMDYGASNFSGGLDFGNTGEPVSIHANASVLAGYDEITSPDNASIVLRKDQRTLYNAYLIDQYVEDTDASGYQDNFEIWLNQIAFMLAPRVEKPSDITHEAGAPDVEVVWNAESHAPASYEVTVDGITEESGNWDGSPISFSFGGYDPGVYDIVVTCIDEFGIWSEDTVVAQVVDTTAPVVELNSLTMLGGNNAAEIEWTAQDLYPSQYEIYVNGTLEDSGAWDGEAISISLENLDVGVCNVSILCIDDYDNRGSNTVWITVSPPSTTATQPTGWIPGIDNQTLLLIVTGVLALVIIVLLVRRKK